MLTCIPQCITIAVAVATAVVKTLDSKDISNDD